MVKAPAIARVLPSGEQATDQIRKSAGPCSTDRGSISLPDKAQSRTNPPRPSEPPAATSVLTSGEKARHSTISGAPSTLARSTHLSASQSLISPRSPGTPPPEASVLPSGEKATV